MMAFGANVVIANFDSTRQDWYSEYVFYQFFLSVSEWFNSI